MIAIEDVVAAEVRLTEILSQVAGRWVVAVSGGVDSITLATIANRIGLPVAPLMMHATSPAVPTGAIERIRGLAATEGWQLNVLTAGELDDPEYLENPYNRCYFCKSALYRTMLRQLADRVETGHQLASGANIDDLGEHRPGLIAAAESGVRHPLVEAGIDKPMVRSLARRHGLTGFSELPAQPCLASRVETGLRIEPKDLRFIDRLEAKLRDLAGQGTNLRARLRHAGVFVELDPRLCADTDLTGGLEALARDACVTQGYAYAGLRPYMRGSAFVKQREQT